MVFKSSRQISQKLSLHYDAVWFKLQESSSQVIQFSTEFLFVIEVFRKLLKGLLIRGALCPFLFLIGEWIHSHAVGFSSTRIVILAVTFCSSLSQLPCCHLHLHSLHLCPKYSHKFVLAGFVYLCTGFQNLDAAIIIPYICIVEQAKCITITLSLLPLYGRRQPYWQTWNPSILNNEM